MWAHAVHHEHDVIDLGSSSRWLRRERTLMLPHESNIIIIQSAIIQPVIHSIERWYLAGVWERVVDSRIGGWLVRGASREELGRYRTLLGHQHDTRLVDAQATLYMQCFHVSGA